MVGFLAFMVIVVLGILGLVGGLQWISSRRDERLPGVDPDRLDRMESALGSLESRLDELHDQQRFLERLLAERPERKSLEAGDEPAGSGGGDVDSILFDTGEGEEAPDR